MLKLFATIVVAMAALAARPDAQRTGEAPPALEAVKWYNTPPLALDQLHGKAVLVEVFRTW